MSAEVKKLMRAPRRPKIGARYLVSPMTVWQTDLLFLPTDSDGSRYAVVLIDAGSRFCDAVPVKDKLQKTINAAIQTMIDRKENGINYKNTYTFPLASQENPKPIKLTADAGTEFGGLKRAFPSFYIKRALTARHSQVAMVEALNKRLGVKIFEKQYERELADPENAADTDWVNDLPALVEELNKKQLKNQKLYQYELTKANNADTIFPVKEKILTVGTKVRRALDYPVDLQGKRLKGAFRATDLRWSRELYTISDIKFIPGQPVMYEIKGSDDTVVGALYQRWQLQP